MRESILEQLSDIQENKGQLNEIDLSSALSKLKDKLTSKNSKLNKEFADLISKQFEGDFGGFLKKYLIKQGKKMDTVQMLINYFRDPDEDSYEDMYHLLGVPMLQYFMKKTFGKVNLRGKIRQATPFLKKVSTGNKKLDTFVYLAMSDVLNEKEVEDSFKSQIRGVLDDKLDDAYADEDFHSFLSDLMGDVDGDGDIDEDDWEELGDLEEAFNIGRKLRGVKRGVRDTFSSIDTKNRWKVLDNITDTIPNLKKPILRNIKKDIWDMKYAHVLKILKGAGTKRLAQILTKAILKHIVSQSRNLYFKEDYLADLTDFVEAIFTDRTMVIEMTDSIRDYFREHHLVMQKLKRDRQQKAKDKSQKRKDRFKKAIDRKDPIYKDLYKY